MYAAVDIGGTKTLVASFDKVGNVLQKEKFPTPLGYDEWKTLLAETVAKFATHEFSSGVVALPGKIDRVNGIGVAFGNLPWQNIPAKADAEAILGCRVAVENDANLAGLSEAHLLKDRYRKVLYVTISTGIGSIYIIDGVFDVDTLDAEIGHTLYEHEGKMMEWEDFASGRAIVAKYGMQASDITDPDIWNVIAINISLGLHNVIATLTPEVIVIGGGVGAHLDRFKAKLETALREHIDPLVEIPPLLQAQRAEEAVIYGCYELARQQIHG